MPTTTSFFFVLFVVVVVFGSVTTTAKQYGKRANTVEAVVSTDIFEAVQADDSARITAIVQADPTLLVRRIFGVYVCM